MAAQSITTDLTVGNNEMTLMEAGTTTADFGSGQGSTDETDFYIQGSQSFSRKVSGNNSVGGFGISATGPSVSGQHIYIWANCLTPGLVNTTANGGIRISIGNSTNAYDDFFVSGSEDLVGGWKCYCVDYEATPDLTTGSPSGTGTVGCQLRTIGTINKSNLGVDAIRYGTGIDATGGGSPDPDLTFSDIADTDSSSANQWGVCQPSAAGVNLQGRIRIGADDTSTSTSFVDVDAVVTKVNNNPAGVNANTKTNFSGIILQGSQTNASFSGCLFLSLDATDRGFVDASSATNAATGTFSGCTFLDWGAFDGRSTVTISGSAFKNAGTLTLNGSTVDLTSFSSCSPVNAGINLDDITNCSFTRGSGTHAITTSVNTGTLSLVGNTFSGYGAAGQEAIEFTATSGTVQVNVSGGAIPSFTSAGVTVNFSLSSTLTLTGLKTSPTPTEIRVYDAGTTTEVAGEENNVTGTFAASISVSAVDIVIFNVSYIAIRLSNIDTTSDRTIPIQQQEDRQYENP
jgi:hypothetical protein